MLQSNEEEFNPFKKKQPKFDLAEWIDFFAERYGWSYSEILDMPIPMFVALQEAIEKRNEREKKAMQRKR